MISNADALYTAVVSTRPLTSYWDRSQTPLQCLWFLLPLLVAYTIGTAALAPEGGERLPAIYAERLLGQFFELLGATGYYLPPLAVVSVLLGMHACRPAGDPTLPEWQLWPWMFVESLLYAVPLFLLGSLFSDAERVVLWATVASTAGPAVATLSDHPLLAGYVFSIGAGIYEELVFRLLGIGAVHTVLAGLLRLSPGPAAVGSILVTAILFAAYHFGSPAEVIWPRFAFYALAGAYLGVVYVGRGFGIAVATHAVYDVLAVSALFRSAGA